MPRHATYLAHQVHCPCVRCCVVVGPNGKTCGAWRFR